MLVKSSQQRACMVDIVGNLAYISGVQKVTTSFMLYIFQSSFSGGVKIRQSTI